MAGGLDTPGLADSNVPEMWIGKYRCKAGPESPGGLAAMTPEEIPPLPPGARVIRREKIPPVHFILNRIANGEENNQDIKNLRIIYLRGGNSEKATIWRRLYGMNRPDLVRICQGKENTSPGKQPREIETTKEGN